MSQKKGKTDEDCGYVDLSERIRNYQKDINRSRKKKPKDEDLILSLTCREHRVLKQRLLQPYLSGTWEREFEFKWINTGGLLSDRFEDHVLGDQEKVCAMALCFVLQRILDFCRDGSFFARELLERLSLIIATSEMENFSMSLSPTSLLRFIKLYHGYMFEEIGRQTAWLFPELNPLQTATAVMVTAMSVSSYMLESAVPPIVLSEFKKADDERTQESRRFKDFGNNAFFKKDYSKALYRYTEAIELNPFNHIVYGNRAQVYIEMEKYSSARSDCFRAMLLDETWPKAYYKDADALEKMGRLEYACATLHAAIKNCSPVYPMADLKEINQKLAKVQQALLDKVVTPRKCVADDVEPRSVENDRSVSPPQRGAGDGSNIVVDGLPGSNESCLEGTGAVSKSCIEGAGAVSKSCVEGASAGNDIVIEGAGEGNENVIEDTSEENDIVVDGVGEGNDIVVEGTGAGSDVVEGECLPKMVSPPDEEGRTADSSMADGVMDSVSTSQAERADTDMAMHPKMAVADPNMVPDVHDQVGNVVKGHAGARNRQAGEKADGASGARPRAVKHESVQTEVRRLRNQQTQCGGEAAASKQLSSLQLQQTQNRKLREQRDEYKEKFRLASESLSKSLTEHDKLKRSFSMTGSSVSKMSVELEEIREYREVRQAEYNSVSDERLKERQRHTAEISDMTAALHGAAEQLSATRETMAAVQQELRAKNLLLEERKAALQVEKNKSEQTTGMLRDSQMKMRQVGERAQQAAVSFATATRESSLMALSMAGATYECSIRSHEETLASLKKRAIPYSMLQRIEQVNAECKQVVNSIHSQMTKVQHDFDQHMAALRIGCPLDNLPPMYLAALPGPPPQLCIPWDSVLPACPASTACPPATSGSTTLPAAGVLLPVSSIACTDGAKAAHAQQEIGGATAARAQPQIGGATTARAQPQVAGAKVAHAQQEIGGATAVHAQQEIGGATAARAQPQIGGATAAPIRSEDCGAASVNVRPQTVGGATSGKAQAKPKNNFEKLMLQLLKSFPRQLKSALTKLIQEVRNERGGTLSGMPIDTIVDKIREKVAKQTEMQRQSPAWNVPPKNLQKSQFTEQEDEEPCVICHEEIKISSSLKLKCGHKYHTECIKRWLKKQSTCPTCRVHVLIPDEFPELSRS